MKWCCFEDKQFILRLIGFFKDVCSYPACWSKSIVRTSRGSLAPKREKEFFLCGQMCDFLHYLLRRVIKMSDLRDGKVWEKLRSFRFAEIELLSVPDFMQKPNSVPRR